MLRDSRVRAVVWSLIGVLVAAIVAFVLSAVAVTGQIRQTQLEGTPTGQKLIAASERILDCTDPGTATSPPGKCYAKNQQRTADLVGQISAGNVLAVVCALQVPNGTPLEQALDEVSSCVAKRLKNAG